MVNKIEIEDEKKRNKRENANDARIKKNCFSLILTAERSMCVFVMDMDVMTLHLDEREIRI